MSYSYHVDKKAGFSIAVDIKWFINKLISLAKLPAWARVAVNLASLTLAIKITYQNIHAYSHTIFIYGDTGTTHPQPKHTNTILQNNKNIILGGICLKLPIKSTSHFSENFKSASVVPIKMKDVILLNDE